LRCESDRDERKDVRSGSDLSRAVDHDMRIETHAVTEDNVLSNDGERSDVATVTDARACGNDGGLVDKGVHSGLLRLGRRLGFR
jgi:hypothetical protein